MSLIFKRRRAKSSRSLYRLVIVFKPWGHLPRSVQRLIKNMYVPLTSSFFKNQRLKAVKQFSTKQITNSLQLLVFKIARCINANAKCFTKGSLAKSSSKASCPPEEAPVAVCTLKQWNIFFAAVFSFNNFPVLHYECGCISLMSFAAVKLSEKTMDPSGPKPGLKQKLLRFYRIVFFL